MEFGLSRQRWMAIAIVIAILVAGTVVIPGCRESSDTSSDRPDPDPADKQATPRRYRGPADRVIGRVPGGPIRLGDLDSARHDMEQLAQYVGLDIFLGTPHHEAFLTLRRNGPEARLAYCLLLREADKAGTTVSEDEIDQFLVNVAKDPRSAKPLVEETYRDLIARIRERGITEQQFRALIGRWLTIHGAYAAAVDKTPPAPAEVDRLFRDLAEQINLRVLRIEAQDLLKGVPAKGRDVDIEAQYERYASGPAGVPTSTDSFGFGYLVPHRVQVGYLLIDEDTIARATRPTDRAIEEYWIDHETEFTKEVPIDPPGAAKKPASATTTKPATKTVLKTLAEAVDEIVERLRGDLVRQRLESVTSHIANVRDKLVDEADTGQLDTYRRILEQMTLPADRVLKRQIRTKFTAMPLDKAVAKLARDAGLRGICYPWGEQGKYTLDPKVKVSLDASSGKTLAVALDEITAQAFGAPPAEDEDKGSDRKDRDKSERFAAPPRLRWAMCKGLEGMLFCHGGDVDMFPIRVASTKLLDRGALAMHEVLRGASTARRGGRPMVVEAFAIKEFGVSGRSVAMEVGKDGKRMYVPRGRVMWRLLKAEPKHLPVKKGAKASEYPADLYERVVRDVRLKQAFALAIKRGRQIEAQAGTDGLAAVAKAEKLETTETGMFPRKRMLRLQETLVRTLGRFGVGIGDVLNLTPYMYPWNQVPGVRLPRRDIAAEMPVLQKIARQLPFPGYLDYVLGPMAADTYGQQFMQKAFSLMPADPAKRGPGKPPAVALFLMPTGRAVYVLERIDHIPLVAEHVEQATPELSAMLLANRRWRGVRKWFDTRSIMARTGFTPAKSP